MASDIRVLSEEDFDRWKEVLGVAFMDPPEVVDRFARHHKPEWILGAYADGVMQASASSAPFALGLEGSPVRMGGVTAVACMPEYRRRGMVAESLRQTLRRSRDMGEPLSGLWTPHPALYRRYGWEICTDSARVSFNPKHVALARSQPAGGRIRRIRPDDWKLADRVYRAWAERVNSVLVRDELRWRMVLEGEHPATIYLYESPSGEPEGFAVMRASPASDGATLQVQHLTATTADGYSALLGLNPCTRCSWTRAR
jgi:predicted acetyltransferase